MSMSKKDYEMLAESLAGSRMLCGEAEGLPDGTVDGMFNVILEDLSVVLKKDNPEFRPESFRGYYRTMIGLRQKAASRKAERR